MIEFVWIAAVGASIWICVEAYVMWRVFGRLLRRREQYLVNRVCRTAFEADEQIIYSFHGIVAVTPGSGIFSAYYIQIDDWCRIIPRWSPLNKHIRKTFFTRMAPSKINRQLF